MSESVKPYSVSVPQAGPYIGIGTTKIRELIRRGVLKVSYPLTKIKREGATKAKGVVRTEDLHRLVDDGIIGKVDLENLSESAVASIAS